MKRVRCKPIPGFGWYLARSDGHIYAMDRIKLDGSLQRGRVMRRHRNHDGYHVVSLYGPRGRRTCRVARLVAAAFHGECPPGYEVDHVDEDKTHDSPGNLRYVTHGQNVRKAMAARRRRREGEGATLFSPPSKGGAGGGIPEPGEAQEPSPRPSLGGRGINKTPASDDVLTLISPQEIPS